MRKIYLILLSISSGLLLSLAWPANGFAGLAFLGWIPLLYVEDYILNHREKFVKFSMIFYALPAFLAWNLFTTWWLVNASFTGAAMAIVLNAIMMAIVFNLFHYSRKNLFRKSHGYLALLVYWMSFEYLHLNWELTWVWLNLGNVFSSAVSWVQWYEFTGVFGGTLWVLAVNVLLFLALKSFLQKGTILGRQFISGILLIILPIALSLIMYFNYEEKEDPIEVVVVQPNLDPYSEQYETPAEEVIHRILELARKDISQQTDFVVCPESAIQEYMWQSEMEYYKSIDSLRAFLNKHPHISFVIGVSSREFLPEDEPPTAAAREYPYSDRYYEEYNTGILIDTSMHIQIYHKSKLVAGVEHMPFAQLLKPIEGLAMDLGGTIGTIGISKERTPFLRSQDSTFVAPIICYESVFGEFVSGFANNGADLFFIITNDGWWGNTPGHQQHMSFARLRTIECRRSIARSANTGISAFINQRGDVFKPTAYWNPDVIKMTIHKNDQITFYMQFGDYLAKISAFTTVLFLLISISQGILNRRKEKLKH